MSESNKVWDRVLVIPCTKSGGVLFKRNKKTAQLEFLEIEDILWSEDNVESDLKIIATRRTKEFIENYKLVGGLFRHCMTDRAVIFICLVEPSAQTWDVDNFEIIPEHMVSEHKNIDPKHQIYFKLSREANQQEGKRNIVG